LTKPVTLQPVYILHRRAFSNSSLVLELFSRDHGRVVVVAKGARRARQRNNRHYLPFSPMLASWQGRGEVKTLTALESAGNILYLTQTALYCGLYVNELLMRLCGREEPVSTLFPHYMKVLLQLPGTHDQRSGLRRFERALLESLGYALSLDIDAATGKPLKADLFYYYQPETGLLEIEQSRENQNVFSGEALLAIHDDQLEDPLVQRDAQLLMRQILAYYLGSKPLKSRELFSLKPIQTGRKNKNET